MKQNSPINSFKTRSFRAGGYSVAATAMVLVIVIVSFQFVLWAANKQRNAILAAET